jgi:Family of unknown function (DUF6949)
MHQIFVYCYVAAVGFVAAGILSSFMQLVSGKPLHFNLMPGSVLDSLFGVVLGVLAGPVILMRNAWVGLRVEARPPVWFGLSALIASVWSLFSGCILLALIFSL